MMWPILFVPPLAAKAWFAYAAPWLAGTAVVGALTGRQDAENARNRAELERLAAVNQALTARLANLPTAASAAPPRLSRRTRQSAMGDGKLALLKHIMDANLALRADLDKQDHGEEHRG